MRKRVPALKPSDAFAKMAHRQVERVSIDQLEGRVTGVLLTPYPPGIPLLMICTGTGIAPMRGMIQRRRRLDAAAGGPLALFYGGRTPDELPYLDELRSLPPAFLEMHLGCSRLAGRPKAHVQDVLRESLLPPEDPAVLDTGEELLFRRPGVRDDTMR